MIGGNLFFWFLYHFEFPFFEQYKAISGDWPWKTNKKEWTNIMWKSIYYSLFNGIVVTTFAQLPMLLGYDKHPWTMDSAQLPDPITYAASLFFFMLIEDLTFGMSHRMLHTKWLYQKIHKVHHTHIITVGIAS